MCMGDDGFTGNKVQVCTVGELPHGSNYRDPNRNAWLVTKPTVNANPNTRVVVNLTTGAIEEHPSDLKLGRDRCGRLYASRTLNPNVYPVLKPDAPDTVVDAENISGDNATPEFGGES